MVKRVIDILLSLILGLLSLPVCLIIAIAIKIDDGYEIIYSSQRIGLRGKRFNMLKFRTMSYEKINLTKEQLEEFQNDFKITNDARITKTGYWIRKYGLDEIPQFINVLRGEMSIIGPRPKLPEEIDLYEDNKNELLSVLPGITGYWQVYRESPNSDEIMRTMDLFYIRNRNIVMDLKIIALTLSALISQKNY